MRALSLHRISNDDDALLMGGFNYSGTGWASRQVYSNSGTVKNAGVENVRVENAAPVRRGWKMRWNAENAITNKLLSE